MVVLPVHVTAAMKTYPCSISGFNHLVESGAKVRHQLRSGSTPCLGTNLDKITGDDLRIVSANCQKLELKSKMLMILCFFMYNSYSCVLNARFVIMESEIVTYFAGDPY